MTESTAVARLLDLEEIRKLKHRYVRFMTQARWDELEALLTEDVRTSYSDGKYCFANRAELLDFLRGSHDAARTHVLGFWHVTMPEIEFTSDDEATGIWAMYHFFLDKQSGQQLEMFAYYEDIYRRMPGGWRIASTGYRRVMEQALDRREIPALQLLVG